MSETPKSTESNPLALVEVRVEAAIEAIEAIPEPGVTLSVEQARKVRLQLTKAADRVFAALAPASQREKFHFGL